jgi:hypothetical protein
MLIAVDLDTIASRTNSPGLAWMLNAAFDLGIAETQLEKLTTLDQIEQVPVARALFERAEKDAGLSRRLEAVIEAAWNNQQHAHLQRTALPMRHAATSLSRLARSHALLYVTWRLPQAQEVTAEWLLLHGFPFFEHLTICQEPVAPFQAALDVASPGESIMLITAQCEAMLDAFLTLPQTSRERLLLVAFHHRESFRVETPEPFPVFALPSWVKEHLTDLLAEIDGYQQLRHLLRAG